ncbi:MAG TPA: glycosyltransferase family 2 protein [Gemmataceae bacterium]|nr:glycosyltransferase family 2 protein [Gemmataceae bacterium]
MSGDIIPAPPPPMPTLLTEPPLRPTHEVFRVERILDPDDVSAKRQHRVIAVLPAYNAERTLAATLADFPPGCVDDILLVDDGSTDNTVAVAREMGLTVIAHPENRGYGGNQKTCYRYALEHGADVVVMIHPDYQYDARVIPHAVGLIELGICDVVLGSRVRSRQEALRCGMPWWKYFSNRGLTFVENVALGQNLGDFHSGFRVYRRSVLETIPFERNSDDFVFDTQFLAQAVHFGFRLGDVPVPVRYFDEASSINFRRSAVYGVRTLATMARFWLHRLHIWRSPLFRKR